MVDLTRKRDFAEKKTVSVSAATLKHDEVSGTETQELFITPPNCLVTRAIVFPKTAGQATLTVDFGIDGGSEFGNDVDIDDVGPHESTLSVPVDSGTGQTVTAKFSADPTAGEFVFVLEYIEYTLGCGELTDYKPE